jgi:hypothetical protein
MNEYDDILNRIVEEFYDTGRLVLNEIHREPKYVNQIRGLLKNGSYNFKNENYVVALKNYQDALEIYSGLKDGQIRTNLSWFKENVIEDQIKKIKKLIPSEEPVEDYEDIESEVGIDLDNSGEETPEEIIVNYLDDSEEDDTDEIRIFFNSVKTDLEELYNSEGSVKNKFLDYSKIIKSSVDSYTTITPLNLNLLQSNVAMYYYEIDLAKESQNLTDDFISNKRKELLHLNYAKNNLEILTNRLGLNSEDLLEGNNIDDRIKSLETTLNLESYGEGDELPLFKSGHIIFEEDKFWLGLLKNSDKNIGVEEYEEQQPNGETNKYLVYIGDEITIDDWKRTFCSERNYERYKNIIDSNDISCDIFRGDPKYYEFSIGQKVKFKQKVKLNKTNGEKSYYQCSEKITGTYPNDTIKSRAFILKITEVILDKGKVNLSYDYGDGIEIPLFKNGWGECPQKGEIENVDIFKLEPYEKTEKDTYLGAQKFRRNHFKRFKTEAERLNLSDIEYDILSNQLMEFAGNLQRLGIKPGDIDLRTSKKKITFGGKYTSSITSVIHDLTSNVDIEGATVLSLYENLKNKIFKGATTEQVRIILPYLIEINKRLKDLNKINAGKIVDFVNELDFTNPKNIDNVFKNIIKSVSSQYEYYWGNETKYFIEESDQNDKGLLNTELSVELEFDNSIIEIISKSNIKNLEESCVNIKNVVIDTNTMNNEVNRLHSMVNRDGYTEKFDIKCIKQINYNDTPIVSVNDYLDVKSKKNKDDFLGELSTPFKSSSFGKKIVDGTNTERKNCKIYTKIYNDLIDSLIVKMSEDLEFIKERVLGGDKPFKGLIISDNIFVPLNSLKLYWSNKGMMNDHRITLRYKIDGTVYKINFNPEKCGTDCSEEQTYEIEKLTMSSGDGFEQLPSDILNIQQNESTDRLDEIIENFFDTGKFVF